MAKAATAKGPYGVHPGVEMARKWAAGMKERTGRTLDQWEALARKSGPADIAACRKWLKEKHGLASNAAYWVASRATGGGAVEWDATPEEYLRQAPALVDAMYSGPRAALRPVYEALLARGLALGADVKACPCQTMVPLYRKFVFAEILPATRDRVDLGLALGGEPAAGRLERHAQAAGNRIPHRISLSSVAEVDAEVDRWLRAAYAKGNAAIERDRGSGKPPADLAAALGRAAKAGATFEALTPRMKSEWIAWIVEAKKADTRARRVERAVERLGAGKKTIY